MLADFRLMYGNYISKGEEKEAEKTAGTNSGGPNHGSNSGGSNHDQSPGHSLSGSTNPAASSPGDSETDGPESSASD